jgi:TP901 family phage tail tape measure protein
MSAASQRTSRNLQTLKANLKSVRSASLTTEQAIRKHGSAMQRFGLQARLAIKRYAAYLLPTTGLFAIIGAVRQSITAFSELEKEQTKLEQVLRASQGSLDGTIQKFQELAMATGISVVEITKASRVLSQAGFGRTGEGGQSALISATEAVSKTQLAATFGSTEEVVDGLIAVLRQFDLELTDTGKILDIVNQIAKDFAVESKDIFEGVKKGGATFATLGGSIEEFAVLMGGLRDETRESAAALGTFFKTGGIRLFSAKAENAIKSLNANILATRTLPERLRALSEAFKDLGGSQKTYYAGQLVGIRQASRLIGVLNAIEQSSDKAARSLSVAAGSLDEDVSKKLDDVSQSFLKTKEKVNEAVKSFIDDKTVRSIISSFNALIGGIAGSASALSSVVAPLASLGLIAGGTALIKGVLKPSAKNIDLKNNTLSTEKNTSSLVNLTATLNRSMGIPAGGAGMTPALTGSSAPAAAASGGRFRRGLGRIGGFMGSHKVGMTGIGMGLAGGLIQSNAGDLTTSRGSAMNAVGGAIGGAGMGALVGSMFGPWGTAIGAVTGGLLGLYSALEKSRLAEEDRLDKIRKSSFERFIKTGIPSRVDPRTGERISLFGKEKDLTDSEREIKAFLSLMKKSGAGFGSDVTLSFLEEHGRGWSPSGDRIGALTKFHSLLSAGDEDALNSEIRKKVVLDLKTTKIIGDQKILDDLKSTDTLKREDAELRIKDLVNLRKDKLTKQTQIITRTLERRLSVLLADPNKTTEQSIETALSDTARLYNLPIVSVENMAKAMNILAGASEKLSLAFTSYTDIINNQKAALGSVDLPTEGLLADINRITTKSIDQAKARVVTSKEVTSAFSGSLEPVLLQNIKKTARFQDIASFFNQRFSGSIEGATFPFAPGVTGSDTTSFDLRSRRDIEQLNREKFPNEETVGDYVDRTGGPFNVSIGTRDNVASDLADFIRRVRTDRTPGTDDFKNLLNDVFRNAEDLNEEVSAASPDGRGITREIFNQKIADYLQPLSEMARGAGVSEGFKDILLPLMQQGVLDFESLKELFESNDLATATREILGISEEISQSADLANQLINAANDRAKVTIENMKTIVKLEEQQSAIRSSATINALNYERERLKLTIDLGRKDKRALEDRVLSGRDLVAPSLTSFIGDVNRRPSRSADDLSVSFDQLQTDRSNIAKGQIAANLLGKAVGAQDSPDFSKALGDLSAEQRINLRDALNLVGLNIGDVKDPLGFIEAQEALQTFGVQAQSEMRLLQDGFDEFSTSAKSNLKDLVSVFASDMKMVNKIGREFLSLDKEGRDKDLEQKRATRADASSIMDLITRSGIQSSSGSGLVSGQDLTVEEIMRNSQLQALAVQIGASIGSVGIQRIIEESQGVMGQQNLLGTKTTLSEIATLLQASAASISANALGVSIPKASDFQSLGDKINKGFALNDRLAEIQQELATSSASYLAEQIKVIAGQTSVLQAAFRDIPDRIDHYINDFKITVDTTGVTNFANSLAQAVLSHSGLNRLITDKISAALQGQGIP